MSERFQEPIHRFPGTEHRFHESQERFPETDIAIPPLLPAPIPAAKEEEDGELEKSEGERSLDLDTRLQMLMKGKTANMPAFLMGSDSSDHERNPTPPPAVVKTGPLSREPSPFLSRNNTKHNILSKISVSKHVNYSYETTLPNLYNKIK